jgi:hypothetical protein
MRELPSISYAALVVVALIGCSNAETRNSGHDSGPARTMDAGAGVQWSVDGGAKPSLTADESPCTEKADCVDSPAARAISQIRCMIEVYCLDGMCHAECREACQTVRDDENSCAPPKLCAPLSPFVDRSYCSALPIACTTSAACPKYRPKGQDGTQFEWTCEAGFCAYPGYTHAAR